MKLFELAFACHVYEGMTDFDKAYKEFLDKTSPDFDMQNASHRTELLKWLNAWGCRQFEINFHEEASKCLRSWYEENKNLLPSGEMKLLDLSDSEAGNAEIVYKNLVSVKASARKSTGPTGASKILFALRKEVFPPWDGAIRNEKYDGSSASYKKFLTDTREELRQLEVDCKRHRIMLSDLPGKLGREFSSLVKLIDEYNWVVKTKGCRPLVVDEVERWHEWTK